MDGVKEAEKQNANTYVDDEEEKSQEI